MVWGSKMNDLISHILFIGSGVILTLELLSGGILIGLLLGIGLSILRYKKIGISIINRFVSLLRGTPVILQLSFIYFSTPGLLGLNLSILEAGILTFGLNSSAYMAEILRAGIENLPKGQFEASQTLKIPSFFMWKDVILPQVIRNVLPAMINETISLLKETALISTIGGNGYFEKISNVSCGTIYIFYAPLHCRRVLLCPCSFD